MGFPEGEFGISPPWLLGRNLPGLSKLPHPTLGNVLIPADQQMFSKKCFAVGFSGCRSFLILVISAAPLWDEGCCTHTRNPPRAAGKQ